MILNLEDNCYVCGHAWNWHFPHYPIKRHLVGGWEYAPIYCECTFDIPQTNLEYLEYMDIVNGMKGLKSESKLPL